MRSDLREGWHVVGGACGTGREVSLGRIESLRGSVRTRTRGSCSGDRMASPGRAGLHRLEMELAHWRHRAGHMRLVLRFPGIGRACPASGRGHAVDDVAVNWQVELSGSDELALYQPGPAVGVRLAHGQDLLNQIRVLFTTFMAVWFRGGFVGAPAWMCLIRDAGQVQGDRPASVSVPGCGLG